MILQNSRLADVGSRLRSTKLTAASNALLIDVAEEALETIESMETPDAADQALVHLARLSREENERIRGMLTAMWSARPRAVAEELFR